MVIKIGDVPIQQYIVQLLELYMVRVGHVLSLSVEIYNTQICMYPLQIRMNQKTTKTYLQPNKFPVY
jgi:hypothetical protein